jgi:hypothetical protein
MRELPRYEFRGKMLTAGEIAVAAGRSQNLISGRIFRGTRGDALGDPPMSRKEAGKQQRREKGTCNSRG